MRTHEVVHARIAEANAVRDSGDRESARRRLVELWNEMGPDGDPIHRCGVAHHIADAQDDPHEELTWDVRALEAADSITIEQRQAVKPLIFVDAFYPSLHLNLGQDHCKLGNPEQAREHLAKAREYLRQTETLTHMGPDDAYGKSIREGLERLSAASGSEIK